MKGHMGSGTKSYMRKPPKDVGSINGCPSSLDTTENYPKMKEDIPLLLSPYLTKDDGSSEKNKEEPE